MTANVSALSTLFIQRCSTVEASQRHGCDPEAVRAESLSLPELPQALLPFRGM
jgi:hypothetical protein